MSQSINTVAFLPPLKRVGFLPPPPCEKVEVGT